MMQRSGAGFIFAFANGLDDGADFCSAKDFDFFNKGVSRLFALDFVQVGLQAFKNLHALEFGNFVEIGEDQFTFAVGAGRLGDILDLTPKASSTERKMTADKIGVAFTFAGLNERLDNLKLLFRRFPTGIFYLCHDFLIEFGFGLVIVLGGALQQFIRGIQISYWLRRRRIMLARFTENFGIVFRVGQSLAGHFGTTLRQRLQ
jgi:hypothetical protein